MTGPVRTRWHMHGSRNSRGGFCRPRCGAAALREPAAASPLFFDLVFVAAVAQVGTPLASDYSIAGAARYVFLLLLIWFAWNDSAMYATRFDSDDGIQRASTLLQMIAVIFMAANAEGALDSVSSAGFAAAYAAMRVILVFQYLRALTLREARRLAGEHATGYALAACLWLVSAFMAAPWRYALWGIALAIDVGTAVVAGRHTRALPPDAAHIPERFWPLHAHRAWRGLVAALALAAIGATTDGRRRTV